MSKHRWDLFAADRAEANAVSEEIRRLDAAHEVTAVPADDAGLLADAARDQLDRDIAAIERAAAALRRADPALEVWTDPPPPTMQKPRPVWLLIGVLWLSTALVTLVAAFAISALIG